MGRFATERSVHFQSSSLGRLRIGPSCITPSNVLKVTLTLRLAPGRRPTFSRSAGRNEGAGTLRVETPGSRPGAAEYPAPAVNTVRARLAAPRICTTAPIWGVPETLRTYPEIAPGRSPAQI